MFGYVKAFKPEMKVREYETYKAVYCTLCKRLGKQYGLIARLTLSYDFTFLALLRLSMSDECPGFTEKHCVYNPFKKCTFCKSGDAEFDFTCAAAVIMLYHKLRDNIHDSGIFKRSGYRFIRRIVRRSYRKAAVKFPEIDNSIRSMIERQFELELRGGIGMDAAAEPTAVALGEVISLCSDNEHQKRALYRLGYCMGKWIYLADAVCDLDDDIKSGNFNPLKDKGRDEALATMNVCSGEAGLALELIRMHRYDNILRNIIYLGLINEGKRLISESKKKKGDL